MQKAFAQSGVEAGKVFVVSLAKAIYDCAANDGQSKYQLRVSELLAEGLTEKEAHKKASDEMFGEIAYDVLSELIIGVPDELIDSQKRP